MLHFFQTMLSSTSVLWSLAGIVLAVLCLTATCLRAFESKAAREKRASEKKRRDLRALANQISKYGHEVRQRFPDGAVVVSEADLAEQLRKRPDSVVSALNVLLNEQKVQRTQLSGYWKLHT
jgi:hypothetical protein